MKSKDWVVRPSATVLGCDDPSISPPPYENQTSVLPRYDDIAGIEICSWRRIVPKKLPQSDRCILQGHRFGARRQRTCRGYIGKGGSRDKGREDRAAGGDHLFQAHGISFLDPP